jgi:lipoprotein-anchoring transpeptidase ErfK/SrfK
VRSVITILVLLVAVSNAPAVEPSGVVRQIFEGVSGISPKEATRILRVLSDPPAPLREAAVQRAANETCLLPFFELPLSDVEVDNLARDAFRPLSVVSDSATGRFSVVVEKSKRLLTVFRGDTRLKSYLIGLGYNPIGHKVHQGDNRTPEGMYRITHRVPNSQFHRALYISYPNASDAAVGLANGLISQREHDRIVRADTSEGVPPSVTELGGLIEIHGGGTAGLLMVGEAPALFICDWTFGCIAMENDDLDELYEVLPMGTKITILP